MYVVDNMVSLPCVTFLLLLLNLLAQTFGQNNSENATSTSLVTNLLTPTATTALAPSSTRHPCVTSTVEPAVNVCSPSCSADVSLVGGVAVSSFVAGIIVGVLGVCVVLICVKRPCSLTKEESTQKTQRFTRSERSETVNKENAHRVRGEYEFLPTYHVKQNQDQLATTGDNEEEDGGGEEEKEEEDKMSIHKGPLPPPPVTPPPTAPPPPLPYLPPPPPPALSPPVHQKSCSKEYAIPHIPPSTTKRSDTLLEMYDIPDTSIPLGLTGNLSKSQILISDQSFTGKENKNKGQGKKALNVSLSMDDLPEMTSSTGTEHYYVMDPSPQPSSGAAGSKPRVSPLPAKQKGRKVLKASVSFNHGRQLDSTPATPSSPVPPVQLPSSTNNPIPPKTKRSRQHSKPLHSAKQLIASPHGRQPIPPPLPSKLVPRNPEVVPQLDPTPSMRPPPPSMGPPPPPTEPTPPIQNPRPLTTTSSLTGPPRVKPPPLRPPLQEPATQQSKLDAEKIISRAQSSKAFPPAPSIAPCSYSHSYTEPLQVEYDNIAASKRLAVTTELTSMQKRDPPSSYSHSPLLHTSSSSSMFPEYANIGRAATMHGLRK